MILVDPHIVPKDSEEERTLGDWLMAAVRAFVTAPVLRATIPTEDPSRLKRAQLLNASVEVGDKYGRIHVHFNLNLTHPTKVLLKHPDGRTINDEVQNWFNRQLGQSCFVSVRLAESGRAKNYATKNGTPGGGAVSINREKLDAARTGPN
jgi:hypothetical protein